MRYRSSNYRAPITESTNSYRVSDNGAVVNLFSMEIAMRYRSSKLTTAPLSLTSLQVTVGGQNILQNTLNMTYEHF
jgi:hypothetical protein